MTTNVLIVQRNATSITFQTEGFVMGAREVVRMYSNKFYNLKTTDPVFMSTDGQGLSEYTVGELIREIEG